jgi:hypothetical protein
MVAFQFATHNVQFADDTDCYRILPTAYCLLLTANCKLQSGNNRN